MMASRSPSDAASMSGPIERESGATSYKHADQRRAVLDALLPGGK
jgi:hypothetical protein